MNQVEHSARVLYSYCTDQQHAPPGHHQADRSQNLIMKQNVVYQWRHLPTGYIYTGWSNNVEKRWKQHENGKSGAKYFNEFFMTHSDLSEWQREILASFDTAAEALEFEGRCTRYLETMGMALGDEQLNLVHGGHWSEGPTKGRKHSNEARTKISAAGKGRKHSDAVRAKISAANKGQKLGPMSDKHRAKISAAGKGRKFGPPSPETRAKMCASQKGRKFGPPSPETRAKLSAAGKGRKHSDEARAKLSAASKGQKRSDAVRAKISAAGKGRKHSDEARAKISAANKDRKHSDTVRAKISAAKKAHHARERLNRSIAESE